MHIFVYPIMADHCQVYKVGSLAVPAPCRSDRGTGRMAQNSIQVVEISFFSSPQAHLTKSVLDCWQLQWRRKRRRFCLDCGGRGAW